MSEHQHRICVSIASSDGSLATCLAAAKRVEALADVIEIRLDSLDCPEVAVFLEELGKPLLFTNRPSWEGGAWRGAEEKRLDLLVEAVRQGAAYVDLELRAPGSSRARLLGALTGTTTKLVVSWHDFSNTPAASELAAVVEQMAASGAHIGKLVTTAHGFQEVLRVLSLQERARELGFPLIAFAMGRAGAISRLATLELGGFMTYAAADQASATAPGQLPVAVMRDIYSKLDGPAKVHRTTEDG